MAITKGKRKSSKGSQKKMKSKVRRLSAVKSGKGGGKVNNKKSTGALTKARKKGKKLSTKSTKSKKKSWLAIFK